MTHKTLDAFCTAMFSDFNGVYISTGVKKELLSGSKTHRGSYHHDLVLGQHYSFAICYIYLPFVVNDQK